MGMCYLHNRTINMDNSQSSDVFSNSSDFVHNGSMTTMDTVSYDSLVSKTKLTLSKNLQKEVQKSSFSSFFSSVLDDCSTCISHSLELVVGLLSDADFSLPHLCQYLEDAANILRMLSSLITTVIESITMSSCNMNTFPLTTGRIVMMVFSHCKDSESLYGNNLKSVEQQLKDLFRNCHELQLTYLIVLEKHFIFDVMENEELDLLVEALDINLKIGKIVQTLDVKTMAEQWKAYMIICEKYADALKNKHIYQNCAEVLSGMIETNIETAVEINQEEKIIQRSLKVASFTLKILIRISNIFKHSSDKNHHRILELLLYIYQLHPTFLVGISGKSAHFVKLINATVTNPSDALLKELLLDTAFVYCLAKYEVNELDKQKLLAYIVIIVSAMKVTLQGNDYAHVKLRLVECVFKWLPYGHIWFNMNLKFTIQSNEDSLTFGLYKHLLAHTFALTYTLDGEEYTFVEGNIIKCLLSTDCYSALFASNLWELLARISPRQCSLNQLITLCEMYQKLENHKLFPTSPQRTHLSYTMKKLFKVIHTLDKAHVYRKFDISDDKNIGLWSALTVKNLPEDLQSTAENMVIEKLERRAHKIASYGVQSPEEIDNLIKVLRLNATCSFVDKMDLVEELIVKAWMKLCQNKLSTSNEAFDEDTMWYLEYVDALATFTIAMKYVLQKSGSLLKILHVVSSIIIKGNTELKLVLINLLCTIALQPVLPNENKQSIDNLLIQTFIHLFEEPKSIVRNTFFNEIRKYKNYNNIKGIISEVTRNAALNETWANITEFRSVDSIDLMAQFEATLDLKYSHKCTENVCIELSDTQSMEKMDSAGSKNFEFADIDTLFESESDNEPAFKKPKLDTNDVDEILTRLENDTSLLCDVKENVVNNCFQDRIRIVCDKLKNIIE